MAAPKVRADYEQLQDVAGRFGSQAQAARQTLQRLQQHMDVLQSGDWLGQGASAFYNEMNSQVVPTMNRLIGALEQAALTTHQIGQTMAWAEADAARVLRGDGAAQRGILASAPGLGAGAFGGAPSPGPSNPPPSTGGNASAGAAGGRGAATPQQIGQAVRQSVDAVRANYGDEYAAASALGAINGAKETPSTVRAAMIDALLKDSSPAVQAVAREALKTAQEAAVDRQLRGFRQGVRDLVKQSPTLRDEIYRADQRGFAFVNATGDQSFITNYKDKLVVVGTQGFGDQEILRHLAHEASHGANDPLTIRRTPGVTMQQFVNKGIDQRLHDEGRAELNNVRARMEILNAGGTDIGRSRPPTTDMYQLIYNDYAAGRITWDQAVDQAAGEMRTEVPVADPSGTYEDMYQKEFTNEWNSR